MLESLIHSFLGNDPQASLLVILNLIVIESMLSVDNAAVLATMVMDLPEKDRKRALRIGIFFAYLFRGLCLLFASVLIKISWLKLVGGMYLVYLGFDFLVKKIFRKEIAGEEDVLEDGPVKKMLKSVLSPFWATVLLVEIMDLTFSIDNVFAAVAFTDNIYLICTGVFIGIITMRLVAAWFVKVMERFPFLETNAFLVVLLLGLKLVMGFVCHTYSQETLCQVMESEHTDLYFSLITVGLFVVPVAGSLLFNFPKRREI